MRMKMAISFVVPIILISGCLLARPIAPDFPYDLMLQTSDLPDGFVRTGGSFPETPGAFVHVVGYSSSPGKIGSGISHQIAIYPGNDQAKAAFSTMEKEVFTDAWSKPPDTYAPLNPKDDFVLKCMDVQIENTLSQSCTFLQRHNNLVILVLANVDSKAINFHQFVEMLKKLDSRLPPGAVPMPNNT